MENTISWGKSCAREKHMSFGVLREGQLIKEAMDKASHSPAQLHKPGPLPLGVSVTLTATQGGPGVEIVQERENRLEPKEQQFRRSILLRKCSGVGIDIDLR